MKYIERKTKIISDVYTDYVCEQYDMDGKKETSVKIPINFDQCDTFEWNIGVIYGGSGCGKTTLLKEFGEINEPEFNHEKPLISNFTHLSPKAATMLLSSMGLSSVPTWLRPFHLLSNGEQYRANLALQVSTAQDGDSILIDEFTSVVDRDVAKAMSFALQKYIRKHNKKIILASCHFDIMEWLMPDWTYSPTIGHVEKHDCLRQRKPTIELSIFRCRYEAWEIFKHHHYLTSGLNKASSNYLISWNDKPIAFIGILPFPGLGRGPEVRRVSRIVVLPDFQGLGIGKFLLNYICSLYYADNKQMYIRTMNPALGLSMGRDDNWTPTGGNLKIPALLDTNGQTTIQRPAYSYKWTGFKNDHSTDMINLNIDHWRNISQNQLDMFA